MAAEPDKTAWDRFAEREYARLAIAEEMEQQGHNSDADGGGYAAAVAAAGDYGDALAADTPGPAHRGRSGGEEFFGQDDLGGWGEE